MAFRYDPPGFMSDFSDGQRGQWSDYVSACFDGSIAYERASNLAVGEPCQLYNQATDAPVSPSFAQSVTWNALPGTFVARLGRARALAVADYLLPLTQRMDGAGSYYSGGSLGPCFYRPQDEYCEWHVERDSAGRITRVTFVSEPPEYWQALFGGEVFDTAGTAHVFDGDPAMVLALYRELLRNDEVKLDDLVCAVDLTDGTGQVVYPRGGYNPYNVWNTTRGAIHLTHPANSLTAEIQLAADATVLRERDGRLVTDPSDLIICSAYGGTNRTSDPTIGASVNELAALGARLTLRNPVGLYMHHIDLSPFTTPAGEPITADYFTVIRGSDNANLIERAVFAVPPQHDFTVSDLKVNGQPLRFGAQIAERITVQLVAQADSIGLFNNTPQPAVAGASEGIPADDLQYASLGELPKPPLRLVFTRPPIRTQATAPRAVAQLSSRSTSRPPHTPRRRRRSRHV